MKIESDNFTSSNRGNFKMYPKIKNLITQKIISHFGVPTMFSPLVICFTQLGRNKLTAFTKYKISTQLNDIAF